MYIILIIIYFLSLSISVNAQFNTVIPLIINPMHTTAMDENENLKKLSEIKNVANLNDNSLENYSDNVKMKFYRPLGKVVVVSGYGMRYHPLFHRYLMHNGVDLKANFEPVYAICTGKVKFAGYGRREGNYVVISSGTLEIVYAHLSCMFVQTGECVSAGTAIGVSGNSGIVTGPHLHLGVRIDEQFIDPLYILNLAYRKY